VFGDAGSRFSTGFSASTEQALRVCICLQHAFQYFCQTSRKANTQVHRPVKNREGGPIAGVAFNGGGASRQLGPDDNDPVSGATQIPEASNQHHSSSTTKPINNTLRFSSSNTNAPQHTLRTAQTTHFSSTFSFVFASNRMPALATIRERRLVLCLQRHRRVCLLRRLPTRIPSLMLRSTAC
jgi:hypothetical protein